LPGHYTVLVVGVKETGEKAVPERKLAFRGTPQSLLIPRASPSKKNPTRPGDPMARGSRSYWHLTLPQGRWYYSRVGLTGRWGGLMFASSHSQGHCRVCHWAVLFQLLKPHLFQRRPVKVRWFHRKV